MMVETILESSQDFGMSNGPGAGAGGALPQWKRELLQRRAARTRPPAHPPPPPPSAPLPAGPPAPDDDEELRYGPGIVKRLQSRYLSLALRDAPRRRPSLRRAASLEHLLDEPRGPRDARAAPADRPPTRAPRPASLAAPLPAPAPAARRDIVKRARSVDALSRFESRESPIAPPSPPPPPMPRTARPPRRPTPLLREAERPPADVVRSTLRKFESAPTRRAAPAARVAAVLRGLDAARGAAEPREAEPGPRLPSPAPPTPPPPPPAERPGVKPVSRAALDGIARAGSSVRYEFEARGAGSHLPPLAAANPVLLGRARRIGVIRPMPARMSGESSPEVVAPAPQLKPAESPRSPTPPADPEPTAPARIERRDPPPAALVEPIPRPPPEFAPPAPPPVEPVAEADPEPAKCEPKPEPEIATPVNGHAPAERSDKPVEVKSVVSKIGSAGIERAWSGSPWAGATPSPPGPGPRRSRAPPPSSTSVVFNFSNRKEVPDYIENDGIILRNKRNRIKPGEPGVVVLRPEALVRDSESDDETDADCADCGPPSPCRVTFLNDNVLINGRSSMPHRPDRQRIAKLKLQFDDSLTRTFEYPSETSFCEDEPTPAPPDDSSPQLAQSPLLATLAANTHITSAALSSYTPSKTLATHFQLGVTRREAPQEKMSPQVEDPEPQCESNGNSNGLDSVDEAGGCGDEARSWSSARTHRTDLLF